MFIAVHGQPRGVHSDVHQDGRQRPSKPNAGVRHEEEQHGPVKVYVRGGTKYDIPLIIEDFSDRTVGEKQDACN